MSTLRRAAHWLRGRAGRRRALYVLVSAACATWVAGLGLLGGRCATGAASSSAGGALVLYLQPGTEEATGRELATEVQRLGGVQRAEYVTPAETLARLRRSLAGDEGLLDGIEPAAMPGSVEAVLQPGVEQVLPLSATLDSLRRHPAVAQVALDQGERDTLAAALTEAAPWARRGQLVAAALAALLALTVARLGWRAPRREVAVATLLGAGPAFFLVPAALAAALVAALGALAGAAAAAWTGARLASELPALVPGGALDPVELALVAVAVMLVSALACAFAVVSREAEA